MSYPSYEGLQRRCKTIQSVAIGFYVNDIFIHASGYAREDLLGVSHNIVRHPDMPAEAFADL
ncbi:MAG: hypothetical protein Q8S52_15535 [Methylobacter sp.]|nr:hypothetical protein [Methylobacter sp.]